MNEHLAGKAIAVLGGTGAQGRGLARRFAEAGLAVVLGSRDADRARETAAGLMDALNPVDRGGHLTGPTLGSITGDSNPAAATVGDIVIVAVPWEGHASLLREVRAELAGKVVVDCVNPLGFDEHGAYALEVPEGSAAEQAAGILAESTVVGAFHNISAVLLEDPALRSIGTDVLVLGDDRAATDLIQELAAVIPGVRGIYGGRLRDAHQVEAFTANLISVNRRYRAHAGVRVTYL